MATDEGICHLSFGTYEESKEYLNLWSKSHVDGDHKEPTLVSEQAHPIIQEAVRQLELYFAKELQVFDLPIHMIGTPFQLKVWAALQHIPYGETCSYLDIANRIEQPKAVRAVGGANNRNPVSIIVPCHRVIGANGKLVGYGGGLPKKTALLELESPQMYLI
ncbi:methylated-DNA--[protein]-cysteine S-methyltransferase [Paenibacillus sp. GSMTC-2017]|nr:methylated-DNA--[protein]-cysteine S-methyltransferase [Paenibacillus sp. GSMTC-2017]